MASGHECVWGYASNALISSFVFLLTWAHPSLTNANTCPLHKGGRSCPLVMNLNQRGHLRSLLGANQAFGLPLSYPYPVSIGEYAADFHRLIGRDSWPIAPKSRRGHPRSRYTITHALWSWVQSLEESVGVVLNMFRSLLIHLPLNRIASLKRFL